MPSHNTRAVVKSSLQSGTSLQSGADETGSVIRLPLFLCRHSSVFP